MYCLACCSLYPQVQLPAIWGLSALLLSYRLGVLPAESAASLKLLDKGVAKEALAALVLVQFPVELVSAVIAGRWVRFCCILHLCKSEEGLVKCWLRLGCCSSTVELVSAVICCVYVVCQFLAVAPGVREALLALVLVQFPVELVSAAIAGRWVKDCLVRCCILHLCESVKW
jgi:hypothetical protein